MIVLVVYRAPCGGGRGKEEPLSAIMVLQAAPGDRAQCRAREFCNFFVVHAGMLKLGPSDFFSVCGSYVHPGGRRNLLTGFDEEFFSVQKMPIALCLPVAGRHPASATYSLCRGSSMQQHLD